LFYADKGTKEVTVEKKSQMRPQSMYKSTPKKDDVETVPKKEAGGYDNWILQLC